jgi:hypothetical protein
VLLALLEAQRIVRSRRGRSPVSVRPSRAGA